MNNYHAKVYSEQRSNEKLEIQEKMQIQSANMIRDVHLRKIRYN